jgi:hypothetical protein
LAIVLGVYPNALFRYMTPSVNREVEDLASWTENIKAPRLKAEAATASVEPQVGEQAVAQQ